MKSLKHGFFMAIGWYLGMEVINRVLKEIDKKPKRKIKYRDYFYKD